ncbi:DUF2283 domain-containing protein [Nonomuraea recticatena]|uniref:DUF2283 domain-containing protein n=1 Tax=Nonomuraea recticatena TaxID=46178 RepID=UPI0031F91584
MQHTKSRNVGEDGSGRESHDQLRILRLEIAGTPRTPVTRAKSTPSTVTVDSPMVNFDLDESGRVIGIEILAAWPEEQRFLPRAPGSL